jgi:predicted nuclease of predicted toxin-antitoxin system
MTFFFDNNLSEGLCAGLKAFGEDVTHLREHFADDAPDHEWLPFVGQNAMVLVTRDERIRYRPVELHALRQHRVRAFFLGGKNRTRWQIIEQVVRNWVRMKDIAEKTNPPFAFLVPAKGAKMSRIQLS